MANKKNKENKKNKPPKNSNFSASMKKLFAFLKPFKLNIAVVLLFAVISTVFLIVSPRLLGNITTEVFEGYIDKQIYKEVQKNIPENIQLPENMTFGQLYEQLPPEVQSEISEEQLEQIKDLNITEEPEINFDKIIDIAILLLVLYIISTIFSYLQGFIMAKVSENATFNLRKQLSDKIDRLPLSYFDKRTNGEVLSRLTTDVDTVNSSLNQALAQFVTCITLLIGLLVMMFSINFSMTLIALLTVPVSGFLVATIIKKTQNIFVKQQEQLGILNGHVEETYSAHNVIKVFNQEEKSINKLKQISLDINKSSIKSQFLSGLMMPLMLFITNIGYVLVSILGGYLAIKGAIKIGDIQAFMQYQRQFNQPIGQLSSIATMLQSTAAASERIFEFLEQPEEILETTTPKDISNIEGNVTFENVTFGYTEDKIIINNFNANIKAGQRIAIVGPTGAGKTTLINLIMRFYELNSGSIKIDGIDIKDLRRKDLRKMFGMVLQDTWLFNGTIMENIKYSKLEATDIQVKKISKLALVDHFVNALPDGYNMKLEEEAGNISQGQKQLLTIARAMLANPPMLILDEATSSVDTRTEVLIQKAMDNLMKGRTSFVIAHRLSTIKDADLILVMKDGNIEEQGTHNELLNNKGFYYELYNSQFNDI